MPRCTYYLIALYFTSSTSFCIALTYIQYVVVMHCRNGAIFHSFVPSWQVLDAISKAELWNVAYFSYRTDKRTFFLLVDLKKTEKTLTIPKCYFGCFIILILTNFTKFQNIITCCIITKVFCYYDFGILAITSWTALLVSHILSFSPHFFVKNCCILGFRSEFEWICVYFHYHWSVLFIAFVARSYICYMCKNSRWENHVYIM